MSTPVTLTLPQLEEVLKQFLMPNTDLVRQAADVLNKFLKQKIAILMLLELLQKSQFPEVRQLAGVLMRKKIVGHWGKLSTEEAEQLKKALLEVVAGDPSIPVRKSAGNVVSVIARIVIPLGQWKELLEFLFQCSQSQQADHREIAMSLFDSLTETIGDHLRPHFMVLHKIFHQGLQDPENKVRIAALRGVGSLVEWLTADQEVAMFRELIPLMMNDIRLCISQGYDDEAIRAFEVFDDLVETPVNLVGDMIPDIVRFVLEIGASTAVDLNIRQKALTFVDWVLNFKPKTLIKHNLIGAILQVAFPMCAEHSPESEEDHDEDEEDDAGGDLTAHKFASQLVDSLAIHEPAKYVFEPGMAYINQYIASPNPDHRRAALIGLAVMSEGCSELYREHLGNLVEFVYRGLQDPQLTVREAACIAVGQFSKFLQPDIVEHYQKILPLLLNTMNDPTTRVRMSSCYALEAFCEDLGQEILPYLELLMSKLVTLLQQENNKPRVQEVVISAITSTANAAGKAFLPYYPPIIGIMKQFVQYQDDAHLVVRCRAIECVGLVATAVGREVFQGDLQYFMEAALQGVALGYSELREFTYGFFGHIADLLGADFSQYLSVLVPILIASAESTDGITGVHSPSTPQLEGIEGDNEEDEDAGPTALHIRTGFLDEKSSACFALGKFAEATTVHFVPYINNILNAFNNLSNYFHDDVRCNVITTLKSMAIALVAAYPSERQWQKGVDAKEAPLHPNVQQYIDVVLTQYVDKLMNDSDRTTVTTTCEALCEIAQKFGPPALQKHLAILITGLIKILRKESACQVEQEDEAVADDEDAEMEIALIDAACDGIVDISKVMGPLLLPYFEPVAAVVLSYQQKAGTDEYRSLAVGTLAEVTNAMGPVIQPYLPQLIPVALTGMIDPDEETRSNSIFWCGVLLMHGGEAGVPFYEQVLTTLASTFNNPDKIELPNLLDNACGCVARMILTAPQKVPLQQVLPVLLKFLPLRKDMEENKSVYPSIFNLIKAADPAIANHFGAVLSVFAKVLGSPQVQPEIQAEMVSITKGLFQQYGNQMQQLAQALPAEEQQNLAKYLA